MTVICSGLDFLVKNGSDILLEATREHPMLYAGRGREHIEMYRGNFDISDYVTERRPLAVKELQETEEGWELSLEGGVTIFVRQEGEDSLTLRFRQDGTEWNRFWFRVCAEKGEHCYGCGEQMSYFDLRGRHFPLWTSEPGVGRDQSTYLTWRYDQECRGGGDYYTTNYPQPTYLSSRHYYLHVETSAYADFDFRDPEFHELQTWALPESIRIQTAETFPLLLEKLTGFLGRQPELPDWVYKGLIVGLQGGTERSMELLERTLAHHIPVSAVWCQDWSGRRDTSFGQRLQWNWQYRPELYPNLPETIAALHERGIRFLGYINPYLAVDGALYAEGKEKSVFARRVNGEEYLVDFGEFDCGVVDLTDPRAFQWFKERIIQQNMLAIGMDGWMADFGEYLPTDDLMLASGRSPMLEHNRWPALWAKCNYEALKESGKLGEVVFFMRAGGTGSQKYCTLLWAGDQSVDFSRHDGLCTVICAALSAGMSGCGLHHSDIGGYTSMYENVRTKELFLRWAEMAAFTPVMRTHESNRPATNFQYYEDEDCMRRLARLTGVYTALAPCLKELVAENAARGIPVQRPLFLHNEEDERCYGVQFEYLLGPDILVAPVWQEGRSDWEVYLPRGEWLHLWTGKQYGSGEHTVPAPLGDIPVFYRNDSRWAPLMRTIRERYAGDRPLRPDSV